MLLVCGLFNAQLFSVFVLLKISSEKHDEWNPHLVFLE